MKKTALVTGSSKGIGKAIVLELAKKGYDVCINCSSSVDEAIKVQEKCQTYGVKAIVVQANIATMEGIAHLYQEFFKEYDQLDVLVNNAGITRMIPFLEVSEENWNEVINLNYKGVYFSSQRAAKAMVEKKTKGVIVNITSIHQQILFPFASVYGSAKAGLLKLTKHMALELAKYNIRVVSVAPGATLNAPERRELERTKLLASRIPLRRWGECEEIAKAVAFLVSDDAAYITGITLPVEGGVLLPPLVDYDTY